MVTLSRKPSLTHTFGVLFHISHHLIITGDTIPWLLNPLHQSLLNIRPCDNLRPLAWQRCWIWISTWFKFSLVLSLSFCECALVEHKGTLWPVSKMGKNVVAGNCLDGYPHRQRPWASLTVWDLSIPSVWEAELRHIF